MARAAPGPRGREARVMLGPAMRRRFLPGLLLTALCAPAAAVAAASAPAELHFLRDGRPVRTISAEALAQECGAATVRVDDPYYGREKSFRACPLGAVLQLGFGAPAASFTTDNFFLRASDGYVKPASGSLLAEPGGWLAFADADLPAGRWEPIDRRQLEPGPFYMVWSGKERGDPHRYPWPYQLTAIEIAPFEREYPHTAPAGAAADAPAWQGYAIFRGQCISCHAINGEGGTVGPELNVPQSIVEYRPAEQIKAYVRDPSQFRYTTMPAHLDLTPQDLDTLIAYFQAMATRKHDPRREGAP